MNALRLRPFAGLAVLLAFACVPLRAPKESTPSDYVQAPGDDPDRPRVARGANGAVATAHPLASNAALAMLQKGGNAVDAAVAASFVVSVVRPQSTGIAGGGFLLYHDAKKEGAVEVFDFRERAPLAATRDMYLDAKGEPKDFEYEGVKIPNASVNGHLAVGTPGMVAGLLEVHSAHGRLPLAEVMEPAIQLAENGFPVYGELALAIERRASVMQHFPATREIFLPNGKPLAKGERLVQKDLAWTLRQIAQHGRKGFYEGEVAKRIVAEMRRGNGLLTMEDLASYEVKRRAPVEGTYRGHKIVSMPPPSSGGIHIVQMLNMLEGDDLRKLGPFEPHRLHLVAEVMRRAFADRAHYLGDPEFVSVPIAGLTDKKYAQRLRASIDLGKASNSRQVGAGRPPLESDSTTHVSVVDGWGNAVATTHTINYTFGSCVVAAGTGLVLNDEMDDFSMKPGVPNAYGLVGSEANAIAAKKTMLSSMSPTLVFGSDGKIELVVGSPGGPRIISAVLQTILYYLDHRMPLLEAVDAPRIHHQWLPDRLFVEKGRIPPHVVEALSAMGHQVELVDAMGDVQAVARTPDGWVAASDWRSAGAPRAY